MVRVRSRLEGAAVGEAVTGSVVRQFRRLSNRELALIRRTGLSDQKVALINSILVERQVGIARASERELVRRFAEQRRIVKPQIPIGVAQNLRAAILKGIISNRVARDFVARARAGRFLSAESAREFIKKTQRVRTIPPSVIIPPSFKPSFQKGTVKTLVSGQISDIVKKGILAKKTLDAINKSISDQLKKLGVTDEKIEKFIRTSLTTNLANPKFALRLLDKQGILSEIKEFQVESRVGAIKGVRDKPLTTALTFGVARALPSIFSFLGRTKIIKKGGKFIPEGLKKIGQKIIPKALVGSYIAVSGLEVAKAPSGEKAELIGRKLTTEVLPFHLGTKSGVRGVLRKEIQTELKKELSKLSKNKRAAFLELMKKADLLKKAQVTLRDVDLKRLKRIPGKAKPTILKFLKDQDIIVGGSLGQQTAVKVKRTLVQSDLDLYTEKNPVKTARDLVRNLQKRGIKRVSQVRVRGKPTGRVTIAGKKVAEFHNVDRLLVNIESVIPRWKLPGTFIVRTKSGIRVPKITVQLKRKLIGGFTDPHRSKDLKDARDILNQLFKRAELRARGKFFFREKNIKALEKTFGVRISRKALKKDIKKLRLPPKISIRRFKKPRVLKRRPSKGTVKVGGVIRGRKISRKVKKPSQISQRKLRRISQLPIKRFRPSQRLIKRPRRRAGPSQPPRRPTRRRPPPTRRVPPSQPPRRRPSERLLIKQPTRGLPIKPFPRTPPSKKPPKALLIRRKIRRKRRIGTVQVYNIFGKDKGRFIKLNRTPLTRNDALSRGSFAIDHTTSRTLKIIPAGTSRQPGRINLKEKGYFQRNKKKLRNFKTRKGRKKILINSYIERTKHAIDTRGEKRQLSLARFIKQQGFTRSIKSATRRSVRRSPIRRPTARSPITLRRLPMLKRNSLGQFIKRKRR